MTKPRASCRTRSSGRFTNISNTVVPQFCAEMDGLVSLENVVVMLTSNRPDYIDPAILRPERIDRKVKVVRPDKKSTNDILGIYLHKDLPLDYRTVEEKGGLEKARQFLIDKTTELVWAKTHETEFLEVYLKQRLRGYAVLERLGIRRSADIGGRTRQRLRHQALD